MAKLKLRELKDGEKAKLQQLAGGCSTKQKAWRARVVILASEGKSVRRIVQFLPLHPHTVRASIRRFNAKGLPGLENQHQSGRPRMYDDQTRQTIVTLYSQSPKALGLPYGKWTLSRLQQQLAITGVAPNIGKETIRRILRAKE